MTRSRVSVWYWLRACLQLIASLTGLTVLVAGIPTVLVLAAGKPWPSPSTSFSDLIERLNDPITDPFLMQVLALIGWFCWAMFMASLLREAFWAARSLPALIRETGVLQYRLRDLPVHRTAAGFLIGTLLLAVVTMWRPQAASAQQSASTGEMRPHAAATA